MKNIVICSDGTWNSAYKRRGTNVFKLFEAVDTSEDGQVAFYDDGVGTEKLKVLQLLGGAFGLGLARNVRQLYTHLVRVYNPDDRIYLFGFSRGAFTVRTLADMIYRCGIVDRTRKSGDGETVPLTEAEIREEVRKTYKRYRSTHRLSARPRGSDTCGSSDASRWTRVLTRIGRLGRQPGTPAAARRANIEPL